MGNKEKCLYIYFLSGQKIERIPGKKKHYKKLYDAIAYVYPHLNIWSTNCNEAVLVGDEVKLSKDLREIFRNYRIKKKIYK